MEMMLKMRADLKRSLLTITLFLLLIPIHEIGHLLFDYLEGIQVISYSLFSFQPSVVTATPMTVEGFLAGPLLALLPVLVLMWFYRIRQELRPYFYALLIAVLLGGYQDFLSVFWLLTHR
jgi:hypothetical protein